MSDSTAMFASFAAFLAVFVAVGLSALRHKTSSSRDYFLAGQGVRPWLVGLSAVATTNSGYMFTGMIGFTFAMGASAIWLSLGFFFGDMLASFLIHRRFRREAGVIGAVSYSTVIAWWTGREYHLVRILGAVVTLVFLTTYAAAQLTASAKVLTVLVDWPKHVGAMLAAGLVLAYCIGGGMRASIWTDVVQGVLMVVSMAIIMLTAVSYLGGTDAAVALAREIPGFLDLQPGGDGTETGLFAAALFAFGWLFAGLHVAGQPHVMARIMTLDRPDNIKRVRVWYYSWYVVFESIALMTGMLARLLLGDVAGLDPETSLPVMATQLLPAALVGLIAAGVFSACLSTADSQILACSATLTDTRPEWFLHPRTMRLATGACVLAALLITFVGGTSVFQLVIFAWSGMGCTFVPLLLVYAFGGRPREAVAVSMMVVGPATAVGWRLLGLNEYVYEGMPGTLAALSVWGVYALFAGRSGQSGRAQHSSTS